MLQVKMKSFHSKVCSVSGRVAAKGSLSLLVPRQFPSVYRTWLCREVQRECSGSPVDDLPPQEGRRERKTRH